MTVYTFHMCDVGGFSTRFETQDLPCEIAAFAVAGALLREHPGADFVAVWGDDRPVLTRHRDAPVLRAATETELSVISAATH